MQIMQFTMATAQLLPHPISIGNEEERWSDSPQACLLFSPVVVCPVVVSKYWAIGGARLVGYMPNSDTLNFSQHLCFPSFITKQTDKTRAVSKGLP